MSRGRLEVLRGTRPPLGRPRPARGGQQPASLDRRNLCGNYHAAPTLGKPALAAASRADARLASDPPGKGRTTHGRWRWGL